MLVYCTVAVFRTCTFVLYLNAKPNFIRPNGWLAETLLLLSAKPEKPETNIFGCTVDISLPYLMPSPPKCGLLCSYLRYALCC